MQKSYNWKDVAFGAKKTALAFSAVFYAKLYLTQY